MNLTLEIKTRRYRLQQPWRVMQTMVEKTQLVLNFPHEVVFWKPVGQLQWLISFLLKCTVAFMLYCCFVAVFAFLSGLALLFLVSALVIPWTSQ